MFLPVVITLKEDPVPNIRMNVAKAIQQMQIAVKGQIDLEERFRVIVRDLAMND
jgi:hypothetical protein